MGGQKIWFDKDVQRLNHDERGLYLGEFSGEDSLLAVNKKGVFFTTNFDLSNRYQEEILLIEKLDTEKVFTALYYDADVEFYYIKRFRFEDSENAPQPFISTAEGSRLVALSQDASPRVEVVFGGKHAKREPLLIDAVEFISDKSFRAKGKRITTFQVDSLSFLDPLPVPVEEDIDDDPVLNWKVP